MTSQFHPPKGGFHNQRRDSYRYHGKKIKNHNDPSVSFSHGLLGDVNHVCQGKGRKQRVLTWIKPVFIVGRGVD